MAIYGAGSVWAEGEVMENFFANDSFALGWGYDDAEDLYGLISSVKVGDIIYLKSKSPKSPRMTVKAIGIVSKSLVHYLIAKEKKVAELAYGTKASAELADEAEAARLADGGELAIGVKWIVKTPFELDIEEKYGKLTTIRPSSFYEEFLPSVQNAIIDHLTNQL